MEIINKITKTEFIKGCINKIQTGRMVSLSALFTPFWNPENFLPQVANTELKNIKNIVDEKAKNEAKELFFGICTKWYSLPWLQQRPNCITAIQNLVKDPLLEPWEAENFKTHIVSQLRGEYTLKKDTWWVSELVRAFPGVSRENIRNTWWKEDIVLDMIPEGTIHEQKRHIKKTTEDLVHELSTNANIIDIQKFHTQMHLLEQLWCEKEKIKEVVKLLLTRYFVDIKKWIIYMSKETESEYGRHQLIQTYHIVPDDIISAFDKELGDQWQKKAPERQAEWKIKILISSFASEQRAATKSWIALLYRIFNINYARGKTDICGMILSNIDLEIYYPEIGYKKKFIYTSYEAKGKKLKDNKLTKINDMIEHDDWQKAIEFAKTLWNKYNHHYLMITYQSIYQRYHDKIDHREDMQQLIIDIEKSEIVGTNPLIKRIVIAIITIDMDVNTPKRSLESVEKYISQYTLTEKELLEILKEKIEIFLESPEGGIINNHTYSDDFFTYIDKFPGISQEEKQNQKAAIFEKINRDSFTLDDFLNQEKTIAKLREGFEKIYVNKNMSKLASILHNPWISTIEQFILGDICWADKNAQKALLKAILMKLLSDKENLEIHRNAYKSILPLIEKVWAKYEVMIKEWQEKVFAKALELEDFIYAEELLEIYGEIMGKQNKKQKIKEKRIVKEIDEENIDTLDIEDIWFSTTTITAFNKKIENIKIDEESILLLLNILRKYTTDVPKTTTDIINKKIEEVEIDKYVFDIFVSLLQEKDINIYPTTIAVINKKLEIINIESYNIDYFIALWNTTDANVSPKTIKIIGKKLLAYFISSNVKNHEYKEIQYTLAKTYDPGSEMHFFTAQKLYSYYYITQTNYEWCTVLCKEMLAYCMQLKESDKQKKYKDLREHNQQKVIKKMYNNAYELIDKSLQVLRPLPATLYKETKDTLSVGQLEIKLKELYEFVVKENMKENYHHKVLQLWKEFYVLTQNKEWLEMLKQTYGINQYSPAELKQQLASFLQDRENIWVKEIEELISLFGMENAADILFQLYPQYKPLWAAMIKSMLSQYLGKSLIQKRGFSRVAIPETLKLEGKEMLDRIYTVTEKAFVSYYTQTKKKSHELSDREICNDYLAHSKQEFDKIRKNEPLFDNVLSKLGNFLDKILAIEKPERFIENLQVERWFPDFLQKLNAAEIQEKRRFLIADGMGMGKSLSAILAKETIGAKNCLVVTPSNVVDTRKTYLSDINKPEEKKQWYFAPGKSPKVLVIESADDIKNNHFQDYEYIIISQEKLSSDVYLQSLVDTHFDYMIVDEIHKLKNVSKGKRANALLQIAEKIEKENGYLCLLSWTPIPNKVGDIAMLLKLLYPQEYATTDNRELVQSIITGDTLNLRSLLLPRMQMKKLTDHIDMPELYNNYEYLSLSEKEQFYYDAILADEEIGASEKIMKLRQLILNPKLLDITDIPICSKAKKMGEETNELFTSKNKVVFFVNSFISGVLRPTDNISEQETFIAQMWLDKSIKIRVIDGENKWERTKIQDEFNSSEEKIALFVSWSTADVGIDLTGGECIRHINEPRTQADKDQQEARIYRYGQYHDIEATTYITHGSIEQWIHEYVQLKQDAIMKLYYGIELSILEKRILESEDPGTSAETESEKEVNKWLTTYFRESAQELNSMYSYLKQAWSKNVETLVSEDGEKIAWYYKALSPRSYQTNVNRWNAEIIRELMTKDKMQKPTIVDIWSWPKMLENVMSDELKKQVTSIDMNPHYFTAEDLASWKAKVGNFLSLPYEDSTIDIISSSLSFNETARNPDAEEYNRLESIYELQRILKIGWYAILSTVYSLEYYDKEKLKQILALLWFEVCWAYTGNAEAYDEPVTFNVKTLTIRKKETITQSLDELITIIEEKDLFDGLAMKKDKIHLYNQQNILQKVRLWGTAFTLDLTADAQETLHMEAWYTKLIHEREKKYKSLEKIPDELLRSYGFGKYSTGKSIVLVISLPNNSWLFRYRKPLKGKK